MKYYLLRSSVETGGKTFTMMKIAASDIDTFLKRHAGQVVIEGASAAEVLAQLGRMLDKTVLVPGKNFGNKSQCKS